MIATVHLQTSMPVWKFFNTSNVWIRDFYQNYDEKFKLDCLVPGVVLQRTLFLVMLPAYHRICTSKIFGYWNHPVPGWDGAAWKPWGWGWHNSVVMQSRQKELKWRQNVLLCIHVPSINTTLLQVQVHHATCGHLFLFIFYTIVYTRSVSLNGHFKYCWQKQGICWRKITLCQFVYLSVGMFPSNSVHSHFTSAITKRCVLDLVVDMLVPICRPIMEGGGWGGGGCLGGAITHKKCLK